MARPRSRAERVQTTLAAAYHPSHFLTARFFTWYRPALERRAMALSRAQEFEADRLAAEVAGFDLMGQALLEPRICDDLLDGQFWPEIGRRYRRGETCPENIFQDLRSFLVRWSRPLSRRGQVRRGVGRTVRSLVEPPLARRPSLLPSVSCRKHQRCGRRQAPPAVSWKIVSTTILAVSARNGATVARPTGRRKRSACEKPGPNSRTSSARWRLAAPETGELERLAELRELLHGTGAGIRQDLELLERVPDHIHASWRVARAALEAGDAGGLDLMLRSMRLEWQAIPAGISAIRDAAAHGIIELSPELENRLEQLAKAYDAAVVELSDTTRFDLLEPHDLDAATAPTSAPTR